MVFLSLSFSFVASPQHNWTTMHQCQWDKLVHGDYLTLIFMLLILL